MKYFLKNIKLQADEVDLNQSHFPLTDIHDKNDESR
jgi:hypothetical protein